MRDWIARRARLLGWWLERVADRIDPPEKWDFDIVHLTYLQRKKNAILSNIAEAKNRRKP